MRCLGMMLALLPGVLLGQEKPAAAPDTLVFLNGEQLSGSLEKADAKTITFNSPMAGVLTVKWANVRELHTDKNFAVLRQHQPLTQSNAIAEVPIGPLQASATEVEVATPNGKRNVATADTGTIIDAASFDKAVNHGPGFTQGWGGIVTAGASLVRATENTTTFNGAIALVRTTPTVDWLPPRTRSLLNYNQAYGTSSTSAVNPATGPVVTSTIKSNIFHADAEFDRYVTPRLFGFANIAFNHNYAQTLQLEQAYGGGLGVTIFNNPRSSLDVKGDVHYAKEAFFDSTRNLNLFGSTFSERYLRYVLHSAVFNEFASISPAWNNLNAYSAHANADLTFPVYRSVGFTLGAVDDYLNNAPPGAKKNSVQFVTGLTFTLKPR
jgi:hypothetical protein